MIPDIIGALVNRRAYLTRRKIELKKEYDSNIREIDDELEKIKKAFDVINDAIADCLCPRCQGKGTVRVCDAAGDMDDETCPNCCGTGIAFKEEGGSTSL